MKKTIVLSILILSMGTVCAGNLFDNNNPFPQTTPQTMNNIYETEPAVMQQEAKQQKKARFKKGKNIQEQEIQDAQKRLYTFPPQGAKDEGVQNGSFYMFNN